MTMASYRQYDAEHYAMLNDLQKVFVDAVCDAVQYLRRCDIPHEQWDVMQQIFMLSGDGGVGKSFTYNVKRRKNYLTKCFRN